MTPLVNGGMSLAKGWFWGAFLLWFESLRSIQIPFLSCDSLLTSRNPVQASAGCSKWVRPTVEDRRKIPPFLGWNPLFLRVLYTQNQSSHLHAFRASPLRQMHMTWQVLPGDFQGLMTKGKRYLFELWEADSLGDAMEELPWRQRTTILHSWSLPPTPPVSSWKWCSFTFLPRTNPLGSGWISCIHKI